MKRLFFSVGLCVALAGTTSCKEAAVTAETRSDIQTNPKNYVVLLDRSMSRSQVTREEGSQFISRLSKSLAFGDHITVLQVQELGLTDHPQHWPDDMPNPSDPGFVSSYDRKMLEAEQENVQSAVESLSAVPDGAKLMHTDLFTTLGMAGEYVRDYIGRPTTLILLSDMLQSAKGIEMDHAQRMPSPDWIAQQKEQGLIPNFSGACILVVGADGVTSSGVKVRDFWRSYFAAAGANLPVENYRPRPPLTGQVSCTTV